jgi:SAM-dependent methyltransferase
MTRTDIIQLLIDKIKAKSYLEIGVSGGENFQTIRCENKVGVDPELTSPATIFLTSDEFFKQNKDTFDVIFVDGLHHADQVLRDITHSLKILNEGGYIVCHDMNPEKEEHQIIPFTGGTWNGNCWEAFVQLRQERSDLKMCVVNTDHGCGIIQKGKQELLEINKKVNYKNFNKNRKQWLNLIEVTDFYEQFSNSLQQLLNAYVMNPQDVENNFALGFYYDTIGQTASALSYYLRCAERTPDDLLKYECLIRSSMCFDKQGTRGFTVKGLLQHAISILPKRPEAYYLLSRFFERDTRDGHWNDGYMIASIGQKVCDFNSSSLRTNVDYPGEYAILYQKAVISWWCGLCNESKNLFQDLHDNYDLNEIHKKSVIENLIKLNGIKKEESFASYNKLKYSSLKVKFPGSELIEKNYSEAYQDMFVLTMLNGKKDGTYLEIGAGNSFYGNNTALLEKQFDWKGVALDIDENFVNAHKNERKNPCFLKNATLVNYNAFLSGLDFPNEIDYLQLDCDPPSVTYDILLSIPFETYKFAVITYEHDYYCDETKSFQEKSKKYLESYGYVRVANNISPDEFRSYEDWWIHPDLIDNVVLEKMMYINDDTKKAENYLLNKL